MDACLGATCLLVFVPLSRLLAAHHPSPATAASDSENDDDDDNDGATADRSVILRELRFYAMLGMIAPLPFVTTGIIFFQATLAKQRG